MSFVKRPKTSSSGKTVNPAGGVNPALEPNVSQYGWTSYDAAHVNQIIQYVNRCKNYADEAKDAATYIQGVYGQTQEFIKYIEAVYEELKPLADGLQATYEDIKVRHEDIIVKHTDIVQKFRQIEIWHSEARTYAEEAESSQEAAHISETNAKVSETEAETWYHKTYDLYDDLSKGNVYRGTWNPHTQSYPDAQGTNSTWDVILDEGETEYLWNNIRWFWGDRLVYINAENKYQQIESGTTVTSVNGKKGAVVLSATDVNALPITGGELTGLLKGTRGLFSDNLEVQNSSGQDIRVRPRFIECGDLDASKTQELFVTSRAGEGLDTLRFTLKDGKNPIVRWGSTNHAIYHQGHETTPQRIGAHPNTWMPTASEVGAVPVTTTVNGKPLTSNITLEASDVNARPDTWLPTPQDIGAVSSTTTINGKPLSANVTLNSSDVGALSSTGDVTVSGGITSSTGRFLATGADANIELWNIANGVAHMIWEGSDGHLRFSTSSGAGSALSDGMKLERAGKLVVLGDIYAGNGTGYLEANGMTGGPVYGPQDNVAQWCIANFAPISDSKLKKNIKPTTKSALEDVAKIDFVSYDWKDKSRKSTQLGVTAQQMEEIDPSYAKNIETFKADGVTVDTSIKALDVTNCLALALKAIQELEARVKELEEKNV